MKKFSLSILVIVLLQTLIFAQGKATTFTNKNLESKILTYQPPQRNGVSKEHYDRGMMILESTIKAVSEDGLKFNYADYWNTYTAFVYFKEPQAHLNLTFQKTIDKNPTSTCELIEAFGTKAIDRLTETVPDIFLPFYKTCSGLKVAEEIFDAETYAAEHQLDLSLVRLFHQISEDDQRYRKISGDVDWSKQTPLDEKNLRLIDSLYNNQHTYFGKTLVGEKLSNTMWLVIQHSNIEKMEKYLPIIHQAVTEKELGATPLKMLIDRIYCARSGHQPFGSQFGGEECKISDKKIRAEVEAKYGLD